MSYYFGRLSSSPTAIGMLNLQILFVNFNQANWRLEWLAAVSQFAPIIVWRSQLDFYFPIFSIVIKIIIWVSLPQASFPPHNYEHWIWRRYPPPPPRTNAIAISIEWIGSGSETLVEELSFSQCWIYSQVFGICARNRAKADYNYNLVQKKSQHYVVDHCQHHVRGCDCRPGSLLQSAGAWWASQIWYARVVVCQSQPS